MGREGARVKDGEGGSESEGWGGREGGEEQGRSEEGRENNTEVCIR